MTIKRIDGLLEVVRTNLPRSVESTGDFKDWNALAPALVAIAADLFEGIASSLPPRNRVRAEVLGRSLAEYAIAFAWLAAPDDDGERARRIAMFEKDEFLEREKAENKLTREIAGRPAYANLVESGAIPTELLDDVTRTRLADLKADEALPEPLNTFEMAFQADKRWMAEIDLLARNPFALVYFNLFVGPSFVSHPSVTAVSRVVTGTPPDLLIGAAAPLGVSEAPYGLSLLAFVNMLLVAARALGWPDEAAVRAALDRD